MSGILLAQEKSTETRFINNKKYYIHKVEKGQSLYAISKIYGIDVNVILADNDEAIDGIKAGQELKIPFDLKNVVVNKPIPMSNGVDTNRYITHKVVKKETIYSICKQYNLTDKQLEEYNPTITKGIQPDQILIVGVKKQQLTSLPIQIEDSLIKIVKAKKSKYNIGLALPLKLAEVDLIDPTILTQSKSNFPSVSSLSSDFLMGFQRAIDSLKSDDFKIETFIYDIDDKDSAKVENLCRSEEFRKLDLMIGPVYPNEFKTVSSYAKDYSIPTVSPFTQQNKILFKNSFASKTNPSLYTLMEVLADYCVDSLKAGAVVYIVNNGNVKELQYLKAFKNYYKERLKELNLPLKDSIIEVKGLSGTKEKYIPGKKNIYVLLSNNQVYLADFITQLAVWSDKKDIVLAGWQNISEMENIDQDYLNRLGFTFPCQHDISNIKAYGNLIKEYQLSMNSDPSEYFYMGFDIGQYYLSHLNSEGPSFTDKLDQFPYTGNFLRFNFYSPDKETGFENRGAFIFKYLNFQLYKSLWK